MKLKRIKLNKGEELTPPRQDDDSSRIGCGDEPIVEIDKVIKKLTTLAKVDLRKREQKQQSKLNKQKLIAQEESKDDRG